MTEDDAKNLEKGQYIHYGECFLTPSKSRGPQKRCEYFRVSGKVKRLKREPNFFYVPLMRSIYIHSHIDQWNVERFHREEDCPLHKYDYLYED